MERWCSIATLERRMERLLRIGRKRCKKNEKRENDSVSKSRKISVGDEEENIEGDEEGDKYK